MLILDDAVKVLKSYEVATISDFDLIVVKQTKGFGGTSMTRNLKGIHVTKFTF